MYAVPDIRFFTEGFYGSKQKHEALPLQISLNAGAADARQSHQGRIKKGGKKILMPGGGGGA
jgi:hypothetical protein